MNCEHTITEWVLYAGDWHLVCRECRETQRTETEEEHGKNN
jgi:hypothetical protein